MNRRGFCQSALATAGVLALAPLHRAFSGNRAAEVNALSIHGKELSLGEGVIAELGGGLRSNLLLPGNAAYEEARLVLNPLIDKHPALIVQPTGAADVSLAVQFAQHHQLSTAIKCGGHSGAGKSTVNGGMMIDLSTLRHVRVDADNKIAHVSGGSLLAAMDHESLAQGLITTAGTVSHTGVGGLATGGGFGRLGRKFGLTLDNIHAVDVVSADGVLRHANAQQNQDLYWAVRGGGSNFGVVTGFEFNLHPMQRQVLVGNFIYPYSRLRDVLEFYAEFSANIPDELSADLILGFPKGNPAGFVFLACTWCGEESAGRKAMAPIEKLGKPLRRVQQLMDYQVLQQSADKDAPRATASYLKGGFLSQLSPAVIDDIVGGMEPGEGRSAQMIFQQGGGAIGRVATDATAFPHRYAELNMMATAAWQPDAPAAAHKAWIRNYWSKLVTHTHGFYTNEADDDNEADWNRNYQGNFARLLAIKQRYDPDNIFRLNANIRAV